MESPADLVRAHGSMVWGTIHRLVGVGFEADVADCFQEVFVAALEVAERENVSNWGAMLRRIATVKALGILRAGIRARGRMRHPDVLERLEAAEVSPGAALEQRELAGALRRALAMLPAEQGELFCLRHVEGMSYEEIGEQMNMSAGAVGVTIHRAKERLRELMGLASGKTRGAV